MSNITEYNLNEPTPHITHNDKLIMFDGVCTLCSQWCGFLLKFDKHQIFKLTSVQSGKGQDILNHLGLPTDHFDTMLVIAKNRVYEKSDAFLYVMSELSYPWKILKYLTIFPSSFRNYCYDKIAKNRYKLFGKKDTCYLPNARDQHRFLDN